MRRCRRERWTEPVVYVHPQRGASAFARLLESVTASTDREPDESFDDEDVLAKGEELCRRFRERVRETRRQR
jgi:hypothetical protein